MDKELICVDSSIFIDYYRKTDKTKTKFVELSIRFDLAISIITKLEVLVGSDEKQDKFWQPIFEKLLIIPINDKEITKSIEVFKYLKKANKIIGIQDILIGSTAVVNNLSLSTLNKNDFSKIPGIKFIE